MKPHLSAFVLFVSFSMLLAQPASVVMPAWLAPYPGATAETTTSSPTLIEVHLTAAAKPEEVVGHYQKLIAAAGVETSSNFDGAGTSIRAAAKECDLLVKIREESAGTGVRVSCAVKSAGPLSGSSVAITNSSPGRPNSRVPARTGSASFEQFHQELTQRMADRAAAMERRNANIKAGRPDDPIYPDAPENNAPPLVWPSWLVHVKGSRLDPEAGVDQSHKKYLQAKYVSAAPMTEIYNFYEDLLNAHGYPVHNSKLGTGQTMKGVVQNADGYVEGSIQPYGIGGPHTDIRVSFSRSYLNEPITVRVRVTTYPRF